MTGPVKHKKCPSCGEVIPVTGNIQYDKRCSSCNALIQITPEIIYHLREV